MISGIDMLDLFNGCGEGIGFFFIFYNLMYCGSVYDGLMCWFLVIVGCIVRKKCLVFYGFDFSWDVVWKCGKNGSWEEIVELIVIIFKMNFVECVILYEVDIFWRFDDYIRDMVLIMSVVVFLFFILFLLSIIVVFVIYYCILLKFINICLYVRIYKILFIVVILDILVKMMLYSLLFYELNNILFLNLIFFISFMCKFLVIFK